MNIKHAVDCDEFLPVFCVGSMADHYRHLFLQYQYGQRRASSELFFPHLPFLHLFMPALTGIIADKWMNAEKLYGILHILYGVVLLYVPQVHDADTLYYVIFAGDDLLYAYYLFIQFNCLYYFKR